MAIRVIYKDKNIGTVNESRLDELIKLDRIAAFCRSNDEWVGVEYDPMRREGIHQGPEGDTRRVCS